MIYAEARREAGFELDAVQRGDMPSDFKPMLNVGWAFTKFACIFWGSGA
jgi:hypothetical protein